MVRAIIFDCFGVLTSSGWQPFKERYFGSDQGLLLEAIDLNKQADAGFISYQDFVVAVADLAGIGASEAVQQLSQNITNQPLFDYIATLKADYKIGMLSNAALNWAEKLFTPEQLTLFDEIALSYQTGLIKPEARAYTTIAASLGVAADECVLIDDQESYCSGANDAGMQAICYKDLAQLKASLAGLLTV